MLPKLIIMKKRILATEGMPALPATVSEIIHLLHQDEVDNHRLVDTVKRDASLCVDILHMMNSGLYGLPQKVESIEQAIALLGLRSLKNLVLSSSVMTIISGKEKLIWLHSYSTAMLVSALVKANDLKVSPDLHVAALVHDIGQIILRQFSKMNYAVIDKKVEAERVPIHVAEVERFSVGHDTVSDWLLEDWGISDSIRIPVGCHHQDEVPDEYLLEAVLLQVADCVDLQARNLPYSPPSEKLLQQAGFELEDLDDLIVYQRGQVQSLDRSGHLNPDLEEEGEKALGMVIRTN